jgi:hypothetical protein
VAGISHLGALIADEGHNHAVEVEEEHDEVEAKLDEGFLLVDVQLAEDLGSIQQVGVASNLLDVPSEKRNVEQKRQPVAIDQEEERQKSVYSSLGDDVGVEAVAKVDGVDVVAFQITVHNREEDLKEQVDGIDQHRQQKKPRFSGHHVVGLLVNIGEVGIVVGYDRSLDSVARLASQCFRSGLEPCGCNM